MSQLERDLASYLEAAMGLQVMVALPSKLTPLPHFLAELYELKPMLVNGRLWLAVFLRERVDLKPAAFEKHVYQLPWGEAEGCFLVARGLPGYVRKRLIERRVPFVIPGSQLYLPQFGMELRPKQPSMAGRFTPIEKMSPATQLVVILALNNRLAPEVSPLLLANHTGYTAMTMSRAWNELEVLGLGTQARAGKQRLLSFPEDPKALWAQARGFMRSPVQDIIRQFALDRPPSQLLLAGRSALAELSMLVAPKVPVYAVSREEWKEMKEALTECAPFDEQGTHWIQVWRYPPKLMGMQSHVDPFSLYLSLQEDSDERVQMALDEMMERHKW